ncbi:MAG TPA: hypothetical protein EYG46_08215 [Myxococcales bacterium]|nr:hypothetical protein [Myxococcales bacterium]HIM00961.1 hypothetical protein [Myxococcales bacterium]
MKPGGLHLEGPLEKALYTEASLGIGCHGHSTASKQLFHRVAYASPVSCERFFQVRHAIGYQLAQSLW